MNEDKYIDMVIESKMPDVKVKERVKLAATQKKSVPILMAYKKTESIYKSAFAIIPRLYKAYF